MCYSDRQVSLYFHFLYLGFCSLRDSVVWGGHHCLWYFLPDSDCWQQPLTVIVIALTCSQVNKSCPLTIHPFRATRLSSVGVLNTYIALPAVRMRDPARYAYVLLIRSLTYSGQRLKIGVHNFKNASWLSRDHGIWKGPQNRDLFCKKKYSQFRSAKQFHFKCIIIAKTKELYIFSIIIDYIKLQVIPVR